MTYIDVLPIDLRIKYFLDYFPPTEIIKSPEITTLFSQTVWKAIWKRDISTFNIPENISYEIYKNLYVKYSNLRPVYSSEIIEMIKNNHNKLLDFSIEKLTGQRGDFNIDLL